MSDMSAELVYFVACYVTSMDQADERYANSCKHTKAMLGPARRDVLRQLVERGPVWDGDVSSKSARDDLLMLGLASRAVVKGEQGYTVANYRGWDVHNT